MAPMGREREPTICEKRGERKNELASIEGREGSSSETHDGEKPVSVVDSDDGESSSTNEDDQNLTTGHLRRKEKGIKVVRVWKRA